MSASEPASTTAAAQKPLSGLRVLDLSRVLAGPVCCQLLADLGADVVKVERPGSGDDTRAWGPPFAADGTSAYFLSANRGKRSLALDLNHPAGRAVLEDLIRQADALVENFLPDTIAKLGLTPQRLAELNPRLVSCAISGYGRTGPLADAPGYDLVIQATSGLMSITGQPDGEPMKLGVAITDVLSGLYAATSILAGLLARQRGQEARSFDVALLDVAISALVNIGQNALVTGQRPARYGNAHASIVPYELFPTRDGHLVLAIGNDRQWQRFCEAVQKNEWATESWANVDWSADKRFATNPARVENRGELIPRLNNLMQSKTQAEWQALLTTADVPHAPVLHVDEALRHPQVQARQMITPCRDHQGHAIELLASPIKSISAASHPDDQEVVAPPALGQHTDELLREWLCYSDTQINQLRTAGVIA